MPEALAIWPFCSWMSSSAEVAVVVGLVAGVVFGPAFVQVLAVGVDEAGTVLGDVEHSLGPVGSRVAFDGVQGQLQAASALEQAHALVE